LRRLAGNTGMSETAIVGIVGPPVIIGGCSVTRDEAAVPAGMPFDGPATLRACRRRDTAGAGSAPILRAGQQRS